VQIAALAPGIVRGHTRATFAVIVPVKSTPDDWAGRAQRSRVDFAAIVPVNVARVADHTIGPAAPTQQQFASRRRAARAGGLGS
jgi:hypothetical protein